MRSSSLWKDRIDIKQPTSPKRCSLMYDHCRLTSSDEHGLSRRIFTGL